MQPVSALKCQDCRRPALSQVPPDAGAWGRLTQVVLVPVGGGGVGQRAEVGGGPGAPALCLCLVQVLQKLRGLVQVQVAIVSIQLLLHLPCANSANGRQAPSGPASATRRPGLSLTARHAGETTCAKTRNTRKLGGQGETAGVDENPESCFRAVVPPVQTSRE